MPAAEIKTTVVGSYPIPTWLAALPSTPTLRDAVLVVLKTQELAGLDVISDGELSRFDVNHPETNGMIEYFIGAMSGISTSLTREEVAAFHHQPGMGFRARPAGVVRSSGSMAESSRSPSPGTVSSPRAMPRSAAAAPRIRPPASKTKIFALTLSTITNGRF